MSVAEVKQGNTALSRLWKAVTHTKSGFIGGLIVAFILILAYIVPVFYDTRTTHDPTKQWLSPSAEHPLGTSGYGQDTLKVLIAGGSEPITVGILSSLIALVIAIALGSLAGYMRGKIDTFVLGATDMFISIPGIVVMLILISVFGALSPMWIAVIIGLTTWPFLTRSIRAQVLSLKEREFVEAAKLQNLGTFRILFIEILPNMAGYIVVSFILAINFAIYGLLGLYLIGMLPRGGANWGLMINQAWSDNAYFTQGGLIYLSAPLFLIVLFSIGLITLQRSIEQAVNPRLRER